MVRAADTVPIFAAEGHGTRDYCDSKSRRRIPTLVVWCRHDTESLPMMRSGAVRSSIDDRLVQCSIADARRVLPKDGSDGQMAIFPLI